LLIVPGRYRYYIIWINQGGDERGTSGEVVLGQVRKVEPSGHGDRRGREQGHVPRVRQLRLEYSWGHIRTLLWSMRRMLLLSLQGKASHIKLLWALMKVIDIELGESDDFKTVSNGEYEES